MPFATSIRNHEAAQATHCAICRTPFRPYEYKEIHSASGLHLLPVRTSLGLKYRVTDPPMGHLALKGKLLPLHAFNLPPQGDAVAVCVLCHDEMKNIAEAETRLILNKPTNHAVPPAILARVTLDLVARGRPIVYESRIK